MELLRARGPSGIARCGLVRITATGACGPWGGVVLGLRAKEMFVECICGPRADRADDVAGQPGFRPHRFAGHGKVELRNSAGHVGLERGCNAGNSEVRVGNSELEFRSLVQGLAKKNLDVRSCGPSFAFREETLGHGTVGRGVVWAGGRYDQRTCGPASLWHRPERAGESLRNRSMRATCRVGRHLARAVLAFGPLSVRAIVFRSSSFASR